MKVAPLLVKGESAIMCRHAIRGRMPLTIFDWPKHKAKFALCDFCFKKFNSKQPFSARKVKAKQDFYGTGALLNG